MPHTKPTFFLTIFHFSYPSSHEIQHFEKKNAMKQINFKIEKNATVSETYIELNSLIEYLIDESNYHMKMYLFWNDKSLKTENENEIKDCIKYEDDALGRSIQTDRIKQIITRQFIEFTRDVNENGFN